jgi:hypothetical protein
MKATLTGGDLTTIFDCYIQIGDKIIDMKILPDISDSKSVSYPDENAIGRSMPFKSFQNSENRSISWTAHFVVAKFGDSDTILENLRAIESATYPRKGNESTPYSPPPICRLKCGSLLSHEKPLCAVMKSYSVKFDTSVPWDTLNGSFLPYKLDVDMQFDVVYNQSDLPGSELILRDVPPPTT